MKVITQGFAAAAQDGTITIQEVEDIRDKALVPTSKEKSGIIDKFERAEFAAAAKKYAAMLNDGIADGDAFPYYTSADLVRQLSQAPTANLSLKKAQFTYEASDMAMGQRYLTLKGQAKNGKCFEIKLHGSNPMIFPQGTWSGTIVIQENKDGAAPEAERALTPKELADLGGQRGIGKWFEAAPSAGLIESAKDALRKFDAGYLSGPDLSGECESDEASENCSAEPSGPQVEYRPFSWDNVRKGEIVEELGGISSETTYAYSLLLAPVKEGDPDGMISVDGFYVYVVRSDAGVTEIAELGEFMTKEEFAR